MAATVGHMPNMKVPKNRRSLSTNPVDTWEAVERTMSILELITNSLNNGNYDSILLLNLTVLMSNLPQYGPLIEEAYQGPLDRAFKIFRDACRDEHLNQNCRVKLMALIERRAMNWQKSESFDQYYKNKIPSPECEVQPIRVDQFQGAHAAVPAMLTPTVPLLGPGEQIKSSGRFPQPTRVPGKNYFKDEVVINNADSGKVMGIKGRRVHMIEELSETIISFQRVTPGVKERLVQITGPNEVRINEAIQLMGDTIRRNASPVPFRVDQPDLGSSSSVNSSASEESNRIQAGHHNHHHQANHRLQHSFSTNDTSPEYKHTVTVGPHTIKLTGTNYDLVTESKIILERHFGDRDYFLLENQAIPDDIKIVKMDLKPTVQRQHSGEGSKPAVEMLEPPGKPVDQSGRQSVTASHTPEKLVGAPALHIWYTREMLLAFANSKYCRTKPADWESICPAVLIKVQKKAVTRSMSDPQFWPDVRDFPNCNIQLTEALAQKSRRRVSFEPSEPFVPLEPLKTDWGTEMPTPIPDYADSYDRLKCKDPPVRPYEVKDWGSEMPYPPPTDFFEPVAPNVPYTPTTSEYNFPQSNSPPCKGISFPVTTIPFRPHFKFSKQSSSPEIISDPFTPPIQLVRSQSVHSPNQEIVDGLSETANPKETISFRPKLTNPKLGFLRKSNSSNTP